MPREYRHINQYEREITEFSEQGKTLCEIRKCLDLEVIEFGNLRQDIIKSNENLLWEYR